MHPALPAPASPQGGPRPPWWKRIWIRVLAAVGGITGVIATVYYSSWAFEKTHSLYWPLIAKDGSPTWQFLAISCLIGGFVAWLISRVIDWRALSQRRTAAFQDGVTTGIEEGFRKGYDAGNLAGIDEGRTAGIEEGLSQGKAQGLEAGMRKGEDTLRTSSEYALTRAFFAPSLALHGLLSKEGLQDNAVSIIREYAGLVEDWSRAITSMDVARGQSPRSELMLGAETMHKYLQQLRVQRHPATDRPLLPANYEIYAWCVARVLERLATIQGPGTIRVWTHLKQDMRRWYNIAWEEGRCGYSHSWWEDYKNTVITIKRQRQIKGEPHLIQMRRLVTTNVPAAQQYLVYVDRDATGGLTINQARDLFESHDTCPRIADEITNAFASANLNRDSPIHVIGKCGCDPARHHAGWDTLKEHFDRTYHDKVVGKAVPVGDHDKGVYCAYTPEITEDYSYNDVFLVDLEELKSGLFGLAYYASPAGELDGIVILTDNEIRTLIEHNYRPAWKAAVGQRDVA